MLGNGRLEAQCIDGVKRLCHIRGKMRKKVWVNNGDIILIGLRDYQDAKGDVILKYMADEARSLKQYGELPENIRVNDTDMNEEGEDENAEYVPAITSKQAAVCAASLQQQLVCMFVICPCQICALVLAMSICCCCYAVFMHARAIDGSCSRGQIIIHMLFCLCTLCKLC